MKNTTNTANALDLRKLIQNPNRSAQFWVAYHSLRQMIGKGASSFDERAYVDYLPMISEVDNEEQKMLVVACKRENDRKDLAVAIHRKGIEKTAKRRFLLECSTRRRTRTLVRPKYATKQLWDSFMRNYGSSVRRSQSDRQLKRMFGEFLKQHESSILREKLRQTEERRAEINALVNKLPLYACSGELEFVEANRNKISRMKGNVRDWRHSNFWHLGRDGGGQHELRFRIAGGITAAACSIVSRIGGVERMGGHIHMNCKGDEIIGRKVYGALRYHLSWLRWLTPYARRDNSFCSVRSTKPTFEEGKGHKFSAISANTWNYTGTIEMRLWPSSNKPKDWTDRAAIMQSIGKWSESYSPEVIDALSAMPVSVDTQTPAWSSYFLWASVNDAEVLKTLLKMMRSKAQAAGNRDTKGQENCISLVEQFNTSGVRLVGYRRPRVSRSNPTTTN